MADRSWFQILPKNDVARAIIDDTRNRECVMPGQDGTNKIVVTFDDYFRPDCVLSFGRDRTCSVVCDPPELPESLSRQFSRRQCQFFLEKNTLMLRDDSSGSTTSVRPRQIESNRWEFSSKSTGTPRQRAILESGDWDLAFGSAEFVLQFPERDGWWNQYAKEKKVLATRKLPADCTLTLPIMTLPPTRYQTRVQTPRIPKSKIRDSVIYHELEYLGKGSFGRVSRVIDLQWGGIMAVKIINVERQKEKEVKETLKREVELLAKLSHPHIIDYKHSQGWEFGEPIEIFMSAADGSLRAFLDDRRSQHMKLTSKQITHVSRHIVSALHYLHGEKIIHRDIKPENILFKDIFTNPIFSLADFGFSKEIDSKATFVGTPLYWAPEVCSGAPQDFRVDIWSLGVVIYEMLTGLALDQLPDLTNLVFTSGEWCERLDHACRGGSDLAKMVTLNVENRTTIDMCYGSSTFPVLPDALPSPVARVPTQAPPSPISRTTLQQHPRRHKSRNPLAGGTHYRVEKAQVPLQVQPFRRLQEIGRKPPQI